MPNAKPPAEGAPTPQPATTAEPPETGTGDTDPDVANLLSEAEAVSAEAAAVEASVDQVPGPQAGAKGWRVVDRASSRPGTRCRPQVAG